MTRLDHPPAQVVVVVHNDLRKQPAIVVAADSMDHHPLMSTASNGQLAITKLDQARPTILCIDQMLPESSGYDVCEYIVKTPTLKGLPILMISARGMPEDRALAEELGVRQYLVKPFTQAQFVEHVRLTLEEATA